MANFDGPDCNLGSHRYEVGPRKQVNGSDIDDKREETVFLTISMSD